MVKDSFPKWTGSLHIFFLFLFCPLSTSNIDTPAGKHKLSVRSQESPGKRLCIPCKSIPTHKHHEFQYLSKSLLFARHFAGHLRA